MQSQRPLGAAIAHAQERTAVLQLAFGPRPINTPISFIDGQVKTPAVALAKPTGWVPPTPTATEPSDLGPPSEHQQRWHRSKKPAPTSILTKRNFLGLPLPSYDSCFKHSKRQRLKQWFNRLRGHQARQSTTSGHQSWAMPVMPWGLGKTSAPPTPLFKLPRCHLQFWILPRGDFSNRRDYTLNLVVRAALSPPLWFVFHQRKCCAWWIPPSAISTAWSLRHWLLAWELPRWPRSWLPLSSM